MTDFTIQVLATLVSTLIIYILSYFFKLLKKVPINFWFEILFKLLFFILFVMNVNNLIANIKIVINADSFFKYIIFLIATSFCMYTIIDLFTFIKNEFFTNK